MKKIIYLLILSSLLILPSFAQDQPSNIKSFYNTEKSAIENVNWDKESKNIQKLDRNIRMSQQYFDKGNLYRDKGLFDLALGNYKKSLAYEDNPNKLEILFAIGNIYLDTGKPNLAIDKYKKALVICDDASKKVPIYNNLGLAYMHEGSYDLAIQSFERAISLNSKWKSAYHNLAIIYRKKGLKDTAKIYNNKEYSIK